MAEARVTTNSVQVEYRQTVNYARVTAHYIMVEYSVPRPGAGGTEGESAQGTTETGQASGQAVSSGTQGAASANTAQGATTANAGTRSQSGSTTSTGGAVTGSTAGQPQGGAVSGLAGGFAGAGSTPGSTGGGGTSLPAGASSAQPAANRPSRSTSPAGSAAPAGSVRLTPAQFDMATSSQAGASGALASGAQIRGAGGRGIYVTGAAMKITPAFFTRSFARYIPPRVNFAVERYSWNAIGGPEYATIRAAGSDIPLQFLAQMLRYGVEINDSFGRTVWWGYVHSVELHTGRRVIKLDLSKMYNSIEIEFNLLASTTSGTGTWTVTGAGTDPLSIATYGTRELLEQGTDISTLTAAEAKRDELLSYVKLPRAERESVGQREQPYAVMECRGWFDTLNWKYFSEGDTTDVATTTQISDIVTAAGQFLTATTIVNASGISTNPYRDGNDRAGEVIRQLLEVGSTAGRRLLATVQQSRALRVYSEPANGPATNYRLDAANLLRGYTGQLIPPHTCPVGVWVNDGDGLIGPLDSSTFADPGAFFIERCEYNPRSARLDITPRGQLDPYDILKVQPG